MKIVLLVLISLEVGAQSFYKVIGTSGNDYAEQVINDRDSGYVVVGGTEGLGQGEMDGYMVKLDTAGNLQWTRTFGNENVDWLTSVVLLDDGMLACGYSNVAGDYQMYLVRTNEIGQVVWERTIGNDNWEFPQELTLVNDTTVVLVGEVYVAGSTTTDALVASVSISGDSLWYRTFGGADDDVLERVITSDSGQVYVCGTYTVQQDDTDYWVGRLDNSGDFIWELFLGDTLNDEGHGIAELITGEFVVTGGDNDTTSTNLDNVFYKIDSNGNVLYQNILNNPNDDIGIDVVSYSDTNLFFLVSQSSSVGFGGFDTWVFDCNYYMWGIGDLSFSFGTLDDEWVTDADTTFDRGIITVGNMQDDVLGNVIFVHKTRAGEALLNTYDTEQDLEVADPIGSKTIFYPNPISAGEIHWSQKDRFLGSEYVIHDLQGKVVQSGVVNSGSLTIDLKSGYYLLKIGEVVWNFSVIER
ncbi:hypothetical protein CRYO30217_00726 [Parvicella tangerina]|uniref:T9SS C-terminal target domain-containing protein n=2 Tax=Parvicella tangerina TaxID=2829795 RepID=A0A916JKM3_9FLAO|nr:hypothetical protein CRYO30217_00726 [Parvicella tangerina]